MMMTCGINNQRSQAKTLATNNTVKLHACWKKGALLAKHKGRAFVDKLCKLGIDIPPGVVRTEAQHFTAKIQGFPSVRDGA